MKLKSPLHSVQGNSPCAMNELCERRVWSISLVTLEVVIFTLLTVLLCEPFGSRTPSVDSLLNQTQISSDETGMVQRQGDKAIPILKRALHEKDSSSRKVYAKIYAALPASVSKHLPTPKDANRRRMWAYWFLGQLGTNAVPALPDMIAASYSTNRGELMSLTGALANLGKVAAPAESRLRVLVTDKNDWIKANSAIALMKINLNDAQNRATLKNLLSNSDNLIVVTVAKEVLKEKAQVPGAVVALIRVSKAANQWGGEMAISLLGEIKPVTSEIVQAVAFTMTNQLARPSMREMAVYTLSQFDREKEAALPALIAATSDPNPTIRGTVWSALAQMRLKRADVVPALIQAVDDSRSDVRQNAEYVLQELRVVNPVAYPALKAALQSTNPLVRLRAVNILFRCKTEAREMIPVLMQSLQDEDVRVRNQALWDLWWISRDPKLMLPIAGRLFENTNQMTRITAFAILRETGTNALVFLPQLAKLLEHGNRDTFHPTLSIISAIGPGAKSLIPDVISILRNEQNPDSIRSEAAHCLGRMGSEAHEALPFLKERLEGAQMPLKLEIARALWRIDRETNSTVPVFRVALTARDWETRELATNTLNEIDSLRLSVLVK